MTKIGQRWLDDEDRTTVVRRRQPCIIGEQRTAEREREHVGRA